MPFVAYVVVIVSSYAVFWLLLAFNYIRTDFISSPKARIDYKLAFSVAFSSLRAILAAFCYIEGELVFGTVLAFNEVVILVYNLAYLALDKVHFYSKKVVLHQFASDKLGTDLNIH
jgi:hypothetical protein